MYSRKTRMRRAPWRAVAIVLVLPPLVPRQAWAQADDSRWFEAGMVGGPEDTRPLRKPPDAAPAEPKTVEPPSAPFGAPGEVFFSGASSLGGSYTWWDASQATHLSLTFSPGIDVFVARNVSVGGTAQIAYADGRGYGADSSLIETRATTFSAGPRVGYNVPLGSLVSFYPRLTVGFEWTQQQEQLVSGSSISVSGSPLGYPTTTRAGPWIGADLPLLLHVAPHAVLGFGPTFFQEFGDAQGGPDVGGQRTSVGAAFVVGGWIGGQDPPPPPPDAEPPVVPAKPFGSRGQMLLTSEILLQGSWLRYAGSGSSQANVGVSPGIDVFATDHFSFGASVGGSYGWSSGVDPTTGDAVTFQQASAWFEPRIGVDLPLSAAVSFYPRASVGFGVASQDEKSAGSENTNSQNYVYVALYAPLLVHPASHVFVGFGPTLTRDVTRTFTFPGGQTAQNPSSGVGAGLVVGAWL
jgi:hypothetical protein